jgi:hypothetical protein
VSSWAGSPCHHSYCLSAQNIGVKTTYPLVLRPGVEKVKKFPPVALEKAIPS